MLSREYGIRMLFVCTLQYNTHAQKHTTFAIPNAVEGRHQLMAEARKHISVLRNELVAEVLSWECGVSYVTNLCAVQFGPDSHSRAVQKHLSSLYSRKAGLEVNTEY